LGRGKRRRRRRRRRKKHPFFQGIIARRNLKRPNRAR